MKYMSDHTAARYRMEMADYDCYREEPPEVYEIEDGILLPKREVPHNWGENWMGIGGVADKGGKFVKASGLYGLTNVNLNRIYDEGTNLEEAIKNDPGIILKKFGGTYTYDENELKYIDETVVYFGPYFPQWGHFLLELCARMWYAVKTEYPIVFLSENEIEGNYLKILELLGIDKRRLKRITTPTQYSKILVPEPSCMSGIYYTQEYCNLFERLRRSAHAEIETYDKIYFASNKNAERERGEKEIEFFFRANGFQIFHPGELSAEEQIQLVSRCKIFASPEGSQMNNYLFCSEGTTFICLNKTSYYLSPYGHGIHAARVKVLFVDVFFELYPPGNGFASQGGGPLLMGVSGCLREYAEDNDMVIPRECRMKLCNKVWLTRKWYEYKEQRIAGGNPQIVCLKRMWVKVKCRILVHTEKFLYVFSKNSSLSENGSEEEMTWQYNCLSRRLKWRNVLARFATAWKKDGQGWDIKQSNSKKNGKNMGG